MENRTQNACAERSILGPLFMCGWSEKTIPKKTPTKQQNAREQMLAARFKNCCRHAGVSDTIPTSSFRSNLRQTSPTTLERTHTQKIPKHPSNSKTTSPRRFTLRAAIKVRLRVPSGSRSRVFTINTHSNLILMSTNYRHIISYPHKCNNDVL